MKEQVLKYIEKNKPKTAQQLWAAFRGRVPRDAIRDIWDEYRKGGDRPIPQKYIEALEEVSKFHKLEKGIRVHKIEPARPEKGTTEGAAILVASDWHIEEPVNAEDVNGLNSYDLEESRRRADLFFRNGLKLTQMFSKDLKIKHVVLALLGDFFSNDIHDELAEINLLNPMDAALRAMDYLTSGIEFFLEHSDYELTIVCCSGNHARTTKETYFSAEAGHSLEFFMYKVMEKRFAAEKRVKFVVNTSYHAYLDVLGYKVRFHHGHAIRYGGGIGGLFVPAYKKIDKWNNSIKVDLDIFGHHHQYKDGGSFISNGSMIGYNPYALRNGFSYERAQQAYVLVDAKRGRTISAPILFQ